jgi:hypothetical protein
MSAFSVRIPIITSPKRFIKIPEFITANLTVIDLSVEEMAELDDVDKTSHFRACHPSCTGWGALGFPDCKDSPVFG